MDWYNLSANICGGVHHQDRHLGRKRKISSGKVSISAPSHKARGSTLAEPDKAQPLGHSSLIRGLGRFGEI